MDSVALWYEACRDSGVADDRARAFLCEMELARLDGIRFADAWSARYVALRCVQHEHAHASEELAELDAAVDSAESRLERCNRIVQRGDVLERIEECKASEGYEERAMETGDAYVLAAKKAYTHMRTFMLEFTDHVERKRRSAESRGDAMVLDFTALLRLGLDNWNRLPGYTGPSAACRRRHHRAHMMYHGYTNTSADVAGRAAEEASTVRRYGPNATHHAHFQKHRANPRSPYFVPP